MGIARKLLAMPSVRHVATAALLIDAVVATVAQARRQEKNQ
jgi:hypothetical protein